MQAFTAKQQTCAIHVTQRAKCESNYPFAQSYQKRLRGRACDCKRLIATQDYTFSMRDDSKRLASLRQQLILDSGSEPSYDEITRMLATSLDVPIALINFLDKDRDWFKSVVGLPLRESPATTSFCEIFLHSRDDVLVVEDTAVDSRFADHPLVAGAPFVRFYAAARLRSGEHTLGTLCAYDMKPRKISLDQIKQLQTLATALMELLSKRALAGTQA
jgi:GAF domain-containing protein